MSLIIADLFLEKGLDREARAEIEETLPVIEKLNLVPESIAGLSLLRQSLQSHRISQQALRDRHSYFPES